MQPVQRYDAATLGEVTRTPQGFLRAPARVTRTGVLTYRRADGTLRRELRRPEQVFAGASLATLADAPITDLHPREMVSAKNARELALGHVTGDARADGKRFVEATLLITDAKLIEAVERRDRVEASCGYVCKLIEQPGTYNGEHYDAEQTSIVYNHVGLGPRGWGRAGADVALRLDGKPAELTDDPLAATLALDPLEPPATAPPHKGTRMDLVTIRIDGIDAQVTPQAEQLIRKVTTQLDAATASSADLQKRLDAKSAELDATTKQLAAASDTKRLDGLVADRVALLDTARAVLGSGVDLTGLTSRQVHEKAIAHLDSAAAMAGQSDEYVAAYFAAVTKQAKAAAGGGNGDQTRRDGFPAGMSAADVVRAKLKQREPATQQTAATYEPPAWRQPLSVTRTQ